MARHVRIAKGLNLVDEQPECVGAVFYGPADNPYLPISAEDERGVFYGCDYADVRPFLVEIINSNAGVVRGNHIHMHCTETFTVLKGEIEMYLLCKCGEKHLYRKVMSAGTSVQIMPGIAHAIYTLGSNESTAVFGDNDPRKDRDRVELIALG